MSSCFFMPSNNKKPLAVAYKHKQDKSCSYFSYIHSPTPSIIKSSLSRLKPYYGSFLDFMATV